MIPSSDYSNNVPATAEITTTSSSSGNSRVTKINVISDSSATPITINFCNSNNRSKNIVGVNRDTTVTTTTFISAVADKSNSKDNNHCIGDKDTGFDHSNYRLVKRSNSNVKEVKIGGSVAPRFGISPKSVLQVTGCSSSVFEYSTSADTDLQRCRRTDGKKWRCSRCVVPDQKYCQRHMHKGGKKAIYSLGLGNYFRGRSSHRLEFCCSYC
ncbi:unnamed protein product [Ilex paraguariensis]|uniref:Growth-regulating factor n=1 Tax=Ilex paraguariensis TaxID=185542 RepID=A0ABC8UZU2_9AQUA